MKTSLLLSLLISALKALGSQAFPLRENFRETSKSLTNGKRLFPLANVNSHQRVFELTIQKTDRLKAAFDNRIQIYVNVRAI